MTERNLSLLFDTAVNNKQYLGNELDLNCQRTIETVWKNINILKDHIPQVAGGFGLGFPFHSLDKHGNLIVNPEFSRYSDNFLRKVETVRKLGHEAWGCFSCQEGEAFLPSYCKTCAEIIKPREVMKAMPDIDVFLIVENDNLETLSLIQSVAEIYGFHQSDKNSQETLTRIEQSFLNIKNGREGIYFPCDMHVVTVTDFADSMKTLGGGSLELKPRVHSLHYDWINNQELDFGFDIMFSSSFNKDVCDSKIYELVNIARSGFTKRYSNDEIIDLVASRNKRAAVLLDHEPTRIAFVDKIESWRKYDNRSSCAYELF